MTCLTFSLPYWAAPCSMLYTPPYHAAFLLAVGVLLLLVLYGGGVP